MKILYFKIKKYDDIASHNTYLFFILFLKDERKMLFLRSLHYVFVE